MRLLAFLAKDARLLLRHRALLVALLAYPFLLALVLGAAFQEPPQRLDLVVVNEDPEGQLQVGEETLRVQDLIEQAESFADVRVVENEEAAAQALRAGEADAALLIPPNFLTDVGTLGRNATLRLVVDESDPVRAGIARNAVEGAVDAFVRQVIEKKIQDVMRLLDITIEGGTVRVVVVDVQVMGIDGARARLVEVRDALERGSPERRKVDEVIGFLDTARNLLGNSERYLSTTAVPVRVQSEGLVAEQASLAAVALPGALVLGVFWTGGLAAAVLEARERDAGTLRRLAAAPRARAPATVSKAIVALVAALGPAALLLLLGRLALDTTVASVPLTLLVLAVASLAAAALGSLAAGLAQRTNGAALLVVLAIMPMLLLGGLFFPVAYMPETAQSVARVLPVTLAIDALRGAALRGSGLVDVAPELAGLLVFTLVAGGLGILLARRATA